MIFLDRCCSSVTIDFAHILQAYFTFIGTSIYVYYSQVHYTIQAIVYAT